MLTYFFMGGLVLVFMALTVGIGAFFAGFRHLLMKSFHFLKETLSKNG